MRPHSRALQASTTGVRQCYCTNWHRGRHQYVKSHETTHHEILFHRGKAADDILFSGIVVGTKEPEAARALIKFSRQPQPHRSSVVVDCSRCHSAGRAPFVGAVPPRLVSRNNRGETAPTVLPSNKKRAMRLVFLLRREPQQSIPDRSLRLSRPCPTLASRT